MPAPILLASSGGSGPVVWSRLPIILRLFAAYADDQRAIVDVYNGSTVIASYDYPAITGIIDIDLQPVIRTLLAPLMPTLRLPGGAYYTDPQTGSGTVDVKSYYRLSSAAAPGTLINRRVYAGGWANMQADKQALPNMISGSDYTGFFPNAGAVNKILSYMPDERYMDASECGWITYAQVAARSGLQRIAYFVSYLDGSSTTINRDWPADPADITNTTWYLPIGIPNAALDPMSKGVASAVVRVWGGTSAPVVLAAYNIRYDYRPVYNWLDIHFRNSLGGWDNFRFRGQIIFSTDIARKEAEYKPGNKRGQLQYYDSTLQLKWKANTGYISLQQMIALNDLINSLECYLFFNETYIPLRCTTKTFKWNDSDNGLHNEMIEFESAGLFDTVPQQLLQFFSKPAELR